MSREEYCWSDLVDDLVGTELGSERLMLVTDDFLKAAAAWTYLDIGLPHDDDLCSDPWKAISYDKREWCELSGFGNLAKFKRMIPKLIKLNIIYPDGTLPEDVKFLIVKCVDKHFGVSIKNAYQEEDEEED